MNRLFYCQKCERNVKVAVLEILDKETCIENVGDETKVRRWKQYGKVMVLTHQRHSGIMGLFKKKINYGLTCPNSKIQFKMVIDSASSEPFITMSQKEADEWDHRQAQL
ncbi:hypothetical protein N8459_02275 [Nitrosopumilus sp.]|nr:hypothetical protein [Nitrosopumilus sp.]